MVPGAMGVAGDEKFTHEAELEKIKDIWKEVKVPVLHIHGTKDILVPFENLEFSKRSFNAQYLETIVIPKGNHFIPWKNYDLVKGELLRMIEELK
jgi:pimeloyl-ACP methyl ester carboxylesterase